MNEFETISLDLPRTVIELLLTILKSQQLSVGADDFATVAPVVVIALETLQKALTGK